MPKVDLTDIPVTLQSLQDQITALQNAPAQVTPPSSNDAGYTASLVEFIAGKFFFSEKQVHDAEWNARNNTPATEPITPLA